jgi:hypothetical protein
MLFLDMVCLTVALIWRKIDGRRHQHLRRRLLAEAMKQGKQKTLGESDRAIGIIGGLGGPDVRKLDF